MSITTQFAEWVQRQEWSVPEQELLALAIDAIDDIENGRTHTVTAKDLIETTRLK